ncbi:MAG: tetratricopeptide repeat protein, partial [Acidobacteriota bacterium]
MIQWPFSLGIALALLVVGGLLGDLWARTRRRRARDAERIRRPHYLLGLNHLVSDQPAAAIRELSRAVREETDAVEAYLALGNLLRENGQTERAIDVHKSLLHRKDLSDWERVQVLFALGLDFKKAGLVDRAERTFREVSQRDPGHQAALRCLQQIQEELGDWAEATRLEREIRRTNGGSGADRLPALECEWGRSLEEDDPEAAEQHYRAA